MKTSSLRDLTVSRIGLGALGLSQSQGNYGSGADEAESVRTLHRAIELGITLIDTAESYGPYTNEEFLGRALRGRREQVVIATKFGMISHAQGGAALPDSRPENIRTAVEGSLRRLRTDVIDLYFQHRVDPDTPIEDTIGALAALVAEGKIRHLGLSEPGVATIRRADAVHPITAVESEYSLWTRDPEAEVLPLLRELGIGFVAYSPLGRGFLTGTLTSAADIGDGDWRKAIPRFAPENFDHNLALADQVAALAAEIGASPCAGCARLAVVPRGGHRADSRHQTGVPARGERRLGRPRAHPGPAHPARWPRTGGGRSPQRAADAAARPVAAPGGRPEALKPRSPRRGCPR